VPLLNKSSTRRRSRFGDFLAVLLLATVIAGLGWLEWPSKHPPKASPHRRAVVEPVVKKSPPAPPPVPSLERVERIADTASAFTNHAIPVPPPVEKPEPVPSVVWPVISSNAPVPPPAATEFTRPARDLLEAQLALARRGISPGSIDGVIGSQMRAALAAFQRSEKLLESGRLDPNTRTRLTLDAPLLMDYVVTADDLARLQPLGKTWLAKSEQSALEYETILELVAEKAHAHPLLIKKLNPDVDWTDIVTAGTVLKIGVYNKLVTMRNRYKNAYAQIDVQLKRRYDLIPNLVETAKGYIKHERGTLEAVTAARNIAYAASKAAAANPGDATAMKSLASAETGLGGTLSRLMMVSESVSRFEGEPEHDAAHRGTDLDGKQNLLRAAGLQRLGDDLQHRPRSVSEQPHRRHVQLRRGGTVRHRQAGAEGRAEGFVLVIDGSRRECRRL
jgi:peptidoglycan hydrolase-like protein with peptidoglycan-binding domain